MTYDPDGNLVFADSAHERVRRIDRTSGIISTIAGGGTGGDGVRAVDAHVDVPEGVAFDSGGNLYVSERYEGRVRKIDAATGLISTVAGGGESFGYTGDGGPATSATLWSPNGLEIGPDGNLYIADALNMRIRRVDLVSGIISTVAGGGPLTRAWDQGTFALGVAAGDGGPATLADLCQPLDLAFDHSGNMLIADSCNDRVRRVDASSGRISTVAGRVWAPTDQFSGDGGAATEASLYFVTGVAVDVADNIYAVDYYNRRVRRIDADSGVITTVAGNGGREYRGDGGPATATGLGPYLVTVAPDGSVIVSDPANSRIRRIEPRADW